MDPIEGAENASKKILRGYAIVFDAIAEMGCGWGEKIDRHALDGVDLSNVLLLRDHDFGKVLGRAGKNLRLEVDDVGLFYECELPDTPLAQETFELARAEICDAMSFGFWAEFDTDFDARIDTIKRITNLYEITITPIPAYRQTVVVTMDGRAKELEEARKQEQERAAAKEKADKAHDEAERLLQLINLY